MRKESTDIQVLVENGTTLERRVVRGFVIDGKVYTDKHIGHDEYVVTHSYGQSEEDRNLLLSEQVPDLKDAWDHLEMAREIDDDRLYDKAWTRTMLLLGEITKTEKPEAFKIMTSKRFAELMSRLPTTMITFTYRDHSPRCGSTYRYIESSGYYEEGSAVLVERMDGSDRHVAHTKDLKVNF